MNDTTKHTAGPWLINETQPTTICDSARDKTIAATRGHWPEYETAEADAQLIAASPRLLAALQAIVAGFDESFIRFSAIKNPEFQEDAIAEARAAIAQALGRDGG